MKNILVTGAAGFIGANFVEYFVNKHPDYKVVVVDKLTYAGNMANLDKVKDKISFEKADICDFEKMKEIFDKYDINGVIHFAAESHVDNSIKNPFVFTHTNVIGTHTLLETAKQKWGEGSENKFVHISTDEVYGALGEDGYFTEKSPIQPSSPYSASKASSDLIAFAYHTTYKMNVNVTNCSNNYGPYQHNEKLIPHMIKLAMNNEKLPVYGTGKNIRDWLYVEDHCKAIDMVFHKGVAGERYNIGGHNEKRNIDIVKLILKRKKKKERVFILYKQKTLTDKMEKIDIIKEELKQILSEKRYIHSIGVMEMAMELAQIYNIDIETAQIAGLLHDNAKEMTDDEMLQYVKENNIQISETEKNSVKLLHGKIGADIAKKKYGVSEEIAKAIEYHTTTNPNMDTLAKIIYVSDKIELNRKTEKYDIEAERKLAKEDLDKAMLLIINDVTKYLIEQGKLIAIESIETRNKLLLNIKGEN